MKKEKSLFSRLCKGWIFSSFVLLLFAGKVSADNTALSQMPSPKEGDSCFVLAQEFSSENQEKNLKELMAKFEGLSTMIGKEMGREFDDLRKEMEKLSISVEKIEEILFGKNIVLGLYVSESNDADFVMTAELKENFSDYDFLFSLLSEMKAISKTDYKRVYSIDDDVFFLRKARTLFVTTNRELIYQYANTGIEKSLLDYPKFSAMYEKKPDNYFSWIFSSSSLTDPQNTNFSWEESGIAFLEATKEGIIFSSHGSKQEDEIKKLGITIPDLSKLNGEAKFLDKIPTGEVVYYLEVKNLKFYIELVIKILENLLDINMEEIAREEGQESNWSYFNEKILPLLEGNSGFVFQFYENTPSLTVFNDIEEEYLGSTRLQLGQMDETLQNLSKDVTYIEDGVKISRRKENLQGDSFVIYEVDQAKETDFDGMERLDLGFGITADNILMISAHPNFSDSYQKGELSFSLSTEYVSSIGFFDFDPIFDFVDSLVSFMDLDEVKYYFMTKSALSVFKNFSATNTVEEGFSQNSKAQILFQEPEIVDFRAWIGEQRKADTDLDGLSDFEEKFIFKTDFKKTDSDVDYMYDNMEITRKRNPRRKEDRVYFEDLSLNHFALKSIMALTFIGASEGEDEGKKFRPDDIATRAEILTLALRTFFPNEYFSYYASYATEGYTSFDPYEVHEGFSDPELGEEWPSEYVGYAYYHGMIEGYKVGEERFFKPNQQISRAGALAIILEVAGVKDAKPSPEFKDRFTDVTEKDWFLNISNFAKENGILSGVNGEFLGNQPLTRGEGAVMIYETLLRYK